uniref:Uncharacterized protein n=1 Tax=Rangifer tarandus platyrhynchus TaxID=3082113 RepID=A0ACB0E085_RANTA|nr:unnamed protein product [Rangifer tarandus platyrhynchus]
MLSFPVGGQLRDFRVPGCSAPPARFPTHPSCSGSWSGQGALPASTSAAAHEAPYHWLGPPRVISVTAAAAVGDSRTLGRGGGGGGSGRHLRSSGLPAAAVPRSSRRAARRRRALVRFSSGSAVLGREVGLAGARAEGRCPGSAAGEERAIRSPAPTPGPAPLSPRPPPPVSSQPRDLLSLRSLQSGSPSLGSSQSRVPLPRVPFSHGSPGPGSWFPSVHVPPSRPHRQPRVPSAPGHPSGSLPAALRGGLRSGPDPAFAAGRPLTGACPRAGGLVGPGPGPDVSVGVAPRGGYSPAPGLGVCAGARCGRPWLWTLFSFAAGA